MTVWDLTVYLYLVPLVLTWPALFWYWSLQHRMFNVEFFAEVNNEKVFGELYLAGVIALWLVLPIVTLFWSLCSVLSLGSIDGYEYRARCRKSWGKRRSELTEKDVRY